VSTHPTDTFAKKLSLWRCEVYVPHPLLSIDIAVDVVVVAVSGGRVVAVACQGVQVSLGGFVCHATEWIGAACCGAWEVARGFLFQIDVTAIVIVTPPAIKS